MKPRVTKTKRCRECGAKCIHLDDAGTCYGCSLNSKMKIGKPAESKPKPFQDAMEHPAILKAKK